MQKAKPKASGGSPRAKSRGFTLLELIIVIAILAILSVAVVLVINPAETLARARDSQRLSDLSAVKSAIGLYLAEVSSPELGQSTDNCSNVIQSTTVPDIMVSYPTTTPITDDTVGSGSWATTDPWTGQALAVAGGVSGSGWIPVNLTAIIGLGAPISNYPLDPVNDAENGTSTLLAVTEEALMYTYVCDSSALTFELNATLESARYRNAGASDKESVDGGDVANVYEIGTDLTLLGAW